MAEHQMCDGNSEMQTTAVVDSSVCGVFTAVVLTESSELGQDSGTAGQQDRSEVASASGWKKLNQSFSLALHVRPAAALGSGAPVPAAV